ncbi:MAG: glycosyltransferase family 2 protein [Dehalococcoidia bacterium]
METNALPLVSVVVPMRNEGRYIERLMESLAAQDYPRGQVGVIVVDDGSTDHSAELAGNYAGFGWAAFRLIANEGAGTAAARNTGLHNSVGGVIIQLIGHCELAPDYISMAIATLNDTGADCAGGVIETVGSGSVGAAIAVALGSPFGVGNASFRVGGAEGPVDTVAFGAYLREVFGRIGEYEEGDDAGEDDELNYRLLDAGGLIWLNPALRSRYYSRADLQGLVRQYFGYGRAKVNVLAAHPQQLRGRQLAPAALVGGLASFAALGVLFGSWRPLRLLVRAYASFLGVGAILAGRRRPAAIPYLPGVFAAIHLAYGAGFFAGLWRRARPSTAAGRPSDAAARASGS